jgi:hypothetical protein
MEQFVFDFDATRQDDQLAYRRRLFHVNAVIDRDPWLQMRDVDERSAQILPSLSSSAVLCRAVRAGQLSKRKKMIEIVIAMVSATSVNAIGHATRCGFADFDIGRSALAFVFRRNRARADHEQEESGERCLPKKLPPPTPDRREGRLFPPEQS